MKTRKSKLIGTLAAAGLLSAFLVTAGANAGPGPRGDMPFAPIAIERMAEHLDLDDLQRQEIENILLAAKPEFEALRERVRSEIDAVLTDEQRAKLENSKQRMRDAMQRRLDDSE